MSLEQIFKILPELPPEKWKLGPDYLTTIIGKYYIILTMQEGFNREKDPPSYKIEMFESGASIHNQTGKDASQLYLQIRNKVEMHQKREPLNNKESLSKLYDLLSESILESGQKPEQKSENQKP